MSSSPPTFSFIHIMSAEGKRPGRIIRNVPLGFGCIGGLPLDTIGRVQLLLDALTNLFTAPNVVSAHIAKDVLDKHFHVPRVAMIGGPITYEFYATLAREALASSAETVKYVDLVP